MTKNWRRHFLSSVQFQHLTRRQQRWTATSYLKNKDDCFFLFSPSNHRELLWDAPPSPHRPRKSTNHVPGTPKPAEELQDEEQISEQPGESCGGRRQQWGGQWTVRYTHTHTHTHTYMHVHTHTHTKYKVKFKCSCVTSLRKLIKKC